MIRPIGHMFLVTEPTLGIPGPSLITNVNGHAVRLDLTPEQARLLDTLTEGSYPMHGNFQGGEVLRPDQISAETIYLYSTGKPKPPPAHAPRPDRVLVKSPPRPSTRVSNDDIRLEDLGL